MTDMPATPDEPLAHSATEHPGELLDRFLARLIDGVIIGVVYGILTAIFRPVFLTGFSYSAGEWFLYYAVLSILLTLISLGYFGYMESNRGQTVGKMLLKLRTYGPDGTSNPTMEQAVRRNILYAGYLASIVPIVGWFLGPLAMFVGAIMIAVGINNDATNRQAWHDSFAGGTQVRKLAA